MSNYTVCIFPPLCSSLSLKLHYQPPAGGFNHPKPGGTQAGGMWAHDLLGLGLPVVDDISSVKDELDQYLAEPLAFSSAIYYWQVCYQTVVFCKSAETTFHILGEPNSLSNPLPSHNGHPSNPSLSCAMQEGFFICQGDHDYVKEPDWA